MLTPLIFYSGILTSCGHVRLRHYVAQELARQLDALEGAGDMSKGAASAVAEDDEEA